MDSINFLSSVHISNLITVVAEVTWVGDASIETRVKVTTEDILACKMTHANEAYFVYVTLDDKGKPAQVPSLFYETKEEKKQFTQTEAPRALRLQLIKQHKKE